MLNVNTPRILPRAQHNISRQQIDEDVLKVLYRLHRNGHLAYLVGGSVRDLLLGRQPKDFDIGTDATPSQVRRLFRNCFLVGRRFRLAHIRFKDNKVIEVATFRRHPRQDELPDDPDDHFLFVQNVFGTPGEDAYRRDFTMNALFYDISDFSVIDYTGGLDDLAQRQIRVIGDPDVRFKEDPVRMLRALEFSARLGFSLDDSTLRSIEVNAPLIAEAAPARIREEIMELFRHKVAARVMRMSKELGLLPHLLAGYRGDETSLQLLQHVDDRTASGVAIDEAFAIAALFLNRFFRDFPVEKDTHITAALHMANDIIFSHCRYFSIAQGIRHQAREMLVGCFRMVRGRGRRGERRFVEHPFTPRALELLRLWALVKPELVAVTEEWSEAIEQRTVPAGEARKKTRPRRRRPRRKRPEGGQPQAKQLKT
ncbi:MAG: CCA tRNA nucleotidyltransferase [Desulfuromonas sp.]|nr:MAG: CCA tRNA nucleotidyltransferase [Desulfuromonas sp.]